MRGNTTIVSTEPKGQYDEGYVKTGETHYPGMIVQKDFSVALRGGRHTFKIYDRAADGDQPAGAFWVVTDKVNRFQGKRMTDSIAAGERIEVYAPLSGDELNLLIANLAGTADDHSVGEILMVDDGTGKLIATTGSPETEVAVLKEAITDPVADTWAWCEWSGH
jgi:hypothetical protein